MMSSKYHEFPVFTDASSSRESRTFIGTKEFNYPMAISLWVFIKFTSIVIHILVLIMHAHAVKIEHRHMIHAKSL